VRDDHHEVSYTPQTGEVTAISPEFKPLGRVEETGDGWLSWDSTGKPVFAAPMRGGIRKAVDSLVRASGLGWTDYELTVD
jgi:hypothetical protein